MSHSVPYVLYVSISPRFQFTFLPLFRGIHSFDWKMIFHNVITFLAERRFNSSMYIIDSIYVTNDTLRIRYVVLSHYCSQRMSLTWYFPAATKIWEMDFYFLLYVLSYGMKAPRFFIHFYVRDIFDIWNVV